MFRKRVCLCCVRLCVGVQEMEIDRNRRGRELSRQSVPDSRDRAYLEQISSNVSKSVHESLDCARLNQSNLWRANDFVLRSPQNFQLSERVRHCILVRECGPFP